MKRRGIKKRLLSLALAGMLALQGTEPLLAYAAETLENRARTVSFDRPRPLTSLEDAGVVFLKTAEVTSQTPAEKDPNAGEEAARTKASGGETKEAPSEEEAPKSEAAEEERPKAEVSEEETPKAEVSDEETPEKETPETEAAGEEVPVRTREPEDYYPQPEAPGELIGFTEDSRTYRKDENTYVTVYSGANGVYKDGDGELQQTDDTLEASEGAGIQAFSLEESENDGSAEAPDGETYQNAANDYTVSFPESLTQEKGIVLEQDGCRVQIIPLDGDYTHSTVKGNAILYNQVFPGIDIQYTVIDHSIKEDIIYQEARDQSEFRYELRLEGLEAESRDHVIYLYPSGKSWNEAVYALHSPIMTDAADAECENIRTELSREGDRQVMTVTPDAGWLADEDRVYPVRLDPSAVNIQKESFRMNCVEEGSPKTIISEVGNHYVGFDDGIATGHLASFGSAHLNCRTYFQLNYNFQEIPRESTIDSATFWVCQDSNYSKGSSQFGLYRVDDPWTYNKITWNEQPGTQTFIQEQTAKSKGAWLGYDVKDTVNGWVQGTADNHGLVMKAILEGNTLQAAMQCERFVNNKNPNGPQLSIEWTPVDPDDPVLKAMSLDDTTINLRPMTEKDVKGKLTFDGVFADGTAKSHSTVDYALIPDEEEANKHHQTEAEGKRRYPDSTDYHVLFPNANQYKANENNWQTDFYGGLTQDKLYQFRAFAREDDTKGKEKTSDSFVVYKVKQFDTFPKIARYYGVALNDIMKDNQVIDALVVQNNTIFIRNPKTNAPYNPDPLTDLDKMRIDGALMGRGLHCEFGFEPVNLNTGNFLMEEKDVTLEENGGSFDLTRTYNSKGAAYHSVFGRGWSFTYDQGLSQMEDGSILYTRGDGSFLFFAQTAEGGYQAPAGYDLELSKVSYEGTDQDGISWEIRDGQQAVWAFDHYGMLRHVTQRNKSRVTLAYGENYNLTGITSPYGAAFGIATDEMGRITGITRPDGAVMSYVYDDQDRLTSFTNAAGLTRTYEYDGKNQMTGWVDENGNKAVANTYDQEGRVVEQTDANGNTATFQYGENKTYTTDNQGNKTIYAYDSQKRTTSISYPDQTVYMSYDGENHLASRRTSQGEISWTYDGRGNKLTETREDGAVTGYTYNDENLPETITAPDGQVTSMGYDENGNLTSLANPDGTVITCVYDDQNRLVSRTDGNGNTETYGYTGANLTSYTDGEGNTWTYVYDGMNRLVSTTDPTGITQSTSYSPLGWVLSETAGDGGTAGYTYDNTGMVLSSTDARGQTTSFTYDAMGNMLTGQDPQGQTYTYTYDKNGNRISETDPLGQTGEFIYDSRNRKTGEKLPDQGTWVYTYDDMDHETSVTNGRNKTTSRTYNVLGLVTAETDPEGNQTTYDYDSMGNLLAVRYPDGGVQSYTYDSMGRVLTETGLLGAVTTYSYDGNGNRIQAADDSGRTTSYAYDKANRLIQITNPEGNTRTYTYDKAGRCLCLTDEEGRTETYAYDGAGRILTATDGEGITRAWAYDGEGNVTEETDGNGNKTAYVYDALCQLTGITDPLGNITGIQRDAVGNVTQTVDALKGTTVSEYNGAGREIKTRDALGNLYQYAYDANGNTRKVVLPTEDKILMRYDGNDRLICCEDEAGLVTQYAYDSAGNLVKAWDNAGNSMTYTYDTAGNLISQTDALERTASYGYDQYGRLLSITEADGTVTGYEYDVMDRITAVIDGEGHRTSFTYDKAGNRLSISSEDGAAYQYAYDRRNRVISVIDPLQAATTYVYDGNDNLTASTDANGISNSFTYDANNNLTAHMDGAGNTTAYGYDELNRMISTTSPLSEVQEYRYDAMGNLIKYKDSLGQITEYTYDLLGNLKEEISPKGNKTGYTYDKHQVLTGITDAKGNVTSYETDLNGRVTLMTQPNGGSYQYVYDAAGRMTDITTPLGYHASYTYDPADNVTGESDSLGRNTSYTYDRMHRMTSSTDPEGKRSTFAYDIRGNLVSETDTLGRTVNYGYDLADRLVETKDPMGKVSSLVYDPVGNLTSVTLPGGRTTSYGYDGNDRQTSVTKPMGNQTTADYDASGRLIRLTDPLGQKEEYGYDGAGQLTSETDKAGASLGYAYDPDGNIKSVTDKTGKKTRYGYDPNGNMISVKDPSENKITYEYDNMDQMTAYVDPLGRTTAYTYDLEGNMTSLKDNAGRTETASYDELGRMSSYIYPSGKKIRYQYDKLNNLIEKSYEDARGKESEEAVRYGYDSQGQRVSMMDGLGESSYSYDALGRITETVNSSGRKTAYSYDESDNLQSITYPDGTAVGYGYDLNDNLTRVTDRNGGVTQYEYDGLDRVTGILRPNEIRTDITYDSLDHVTKLVNRCTGCGEAISEYGYTYDKQGYIIKETARESLVGYVYDDKHDGKHEDGKHDSEYPHGNKHDGKHDKDGSTAVRVITTERSYVYDESGQLMKCTEKEEKQGTFVYEYTYDAAGNRIKYLKTKNGSTVESVSYEYNDSNQLIYSTDETAKKDGKTAYAYDEDGNLTETSSGKKNKPTVTTYEYTGENRLKSITGSQGVLMAALYDGDGNRMFQLDYEPSESGNGNNGSSGNNGNGSKGNGNKGNSGKDNKKENNGGKNNKNKDKFQTDGDTGGENQGTVIPEGKSQENIGKLEAMAAGKKGSCRITEYLNDVTREDTQVLVEYDGNGSLQNSYAYGNQRLTKDGEAGSSYYLYDGRGSVASLTDSTGVMKESFRYDAFGQVTFRNNTETNFYGYNGESTNENTGLQYLRNRYYAPSQGRFLSEDSWLGQQTNRLSRNRYLYVENNPLNFTDPSGLAKKSVSKAAQMKAQKELAKQKAGKTHKLDGYQQNIQARQKQQAAAAKRKQQELAKKELAKKKSGKKNTLDGYQKNTIYQSQKRAQANNGYYQSMVSGNRVVRQGKDIDGSYYKLKARDTYAKTAIYRRGCTPGNSVNAQAIGEGIGNMSMALGAGAVTIVLAAATGGTAAFFLGGGLLVGEGGFFVRGGTQVEAGLRGEDGSEAKSPMESVIGSKNETAAEIYRQFENATVLAPYLAEIAGSIGEGGSEKKGGKGDSETVMSNQGNVYDNTPSSNHSTTSGNPIKGEPNSSVDILDKNGNVVRRRWFDSEGNAMRDLDYTNHGNPKTHPEWPHEHIWENGRSPYGG